MRLLCPETKDGRPFIDHLQSERHELRKAGVGYLDWRAMTRWQRADLLARHTTDLMGKMKTIKEGGLEGIGLAVLQRIFGA